MVKSYTRFELARTFGIVASASPPVHLPGAKGPGRMAVAAAEAVHIYDLKTSALLLRLVDPQQDPRAQVVQMALEPHSELLAAGYSDGSIRVWDTRSSSVVVVFNGHSSFVAQLMFSPDGTRLFSGGADTTVVAWDLVNEQGLYRLQGHKAPITALLYVKDRLVSVAKDGVLKLWDLETQFCTETHVHKGECWAAAYVPSDGDHARVATVGTDDIRFWDLDVGIEEGRQIVPGGALPRDGRHRAAGLLFDARSDVLVCAAGDLVQTWRQRAPEEVRRVLKRRQRRMQRKQKPAPETEGLAVEDVDSQPTVADEFAVLDSFRTRAKVSGVALTNQGGLCVNLGANAVECWSLEEPRVLHSVELPGHRTDVRDCCISADGAVVASGANGTIKLHNTRTGAVVRTLADTGYVLALRFLPGDRLLLAATKEGTLDVYDIGAATRLSTVAAHSGAVWSIDVGSDGKTLVSGGADKTVKVWSIVPTSEPVPGHEDRAVMTLKLQNTHKLEFSDDVLAVKLSPDMQLVAASLLDSTVKVYKLSTLKFFLNLYGHRLPVLSIDISHDSKLLVTSSADKNVKLWGLDFGDCHKSIFAHDDSVLRVAFEPESHNFLSASKDGLVKYWDGDKFVLIQTLRAHHAEVWALAVARDGSFAVSASHDKTVRVWEATDEPLFVEEERELELEQQLEEGMANDMNRDEFDETEEVAEVKKHTVESLKAGERLFEALDICIADLQRGDEPRHVILTALDVAPERYLMDVLARIKTPLVEDALLTFPLDRIVGLLRFVEIWLEKRMNLPLVCRVLFFCVRSFHRQIVAAKLMQPELESIRDHVRALLVELHDTIGVNLAGLQLLQQQWDADHVRAVDTEDARGSKREFRALA